MEITAKHPISSSNFAAEKSMSLAEKFTGYCLSLEEYRVFLLILTIIFQVCIVAPATLLITSFYDIGLGGLTVGLLAAGTFGVLVSNMAEMSIKIVLSIFALSTTVSIVLLAMHLLS